MKTNNYNIPRLKVRLRKVVTDGDGSPVNLDDFTNSLHVTLSLIFRSLLDTNYGQKNRPVDGHD